MFDVQILSTLQKATTAAVLASATPAMPVKYVGLTFNIPGDQKYLECAFIPNNIVDAYWDRSKVYRGTYRLLMHWAIDGAGAYPPMEALRSIAAYFTKEVLLSNGVRLLNEPDMGSLIVNGPEIIVPCSIEYRSFQPN